MGAGKPGRGAALGLAVFRDKLAVIWRESEGNLGGVSGSGGAGTGAGKSAGEQIQLADKRRGRWRWRTHLESECERRSLVTTFSVSPWKCRWS